MFETCLRHTCAMYDDFYNGIIKIICQISISPTPTKAPRGAFVFGEIAIYFHIERLPMGHVIDVGIGYPHW